MLNNIDNSGLNIIERRAIEHSMLMKAKHRNSETKSSGAKNSQAIKINIYNSNNELMFECHGNFKKMCEDNELPFNALKKSYKYNTRLYESSNSNQKRIIDNGFINL